MQLQGIAVKTIGYGVSFDVVLSVSAAVAACAAHITPTSLKKASFAVALGRCKKQQSTEPMDWEEEGNFCL